MNIFIPLQKFNLKPILFLFQTLAIQIETIPSNNTIIYNPPLLLVFIHLLQSVSKKKKKKEKSGISSATYFQPVGLGVTAVVAPRQLRPSAFHRDYGCIDPGVTPSSPFRHFPPPATLHSSPLLSPRPAAVTPAPPPGRRSPTTTSLPSPRSSSRFPPPLLTLHPLSRALRRRRRRRWQSTLRDDDDDEAKSTGVRMRWIVAIPSPFL